MKTAAPHRARRDRAPWVHRAGNRAFARAHQRFDIAETKGAEIDRIDAIAKIRNDPGAATRRIEETIAGGRNISGACGRTQFKHWVTRKARLATVMAYPAANFHGKLPASKMQPKSPAGNCPAAVNQLPGRPLTKPSRVHGH